MTPRRAEVLADLAARLAAVDVAHPLRVGVDGVCGVGKSTFARDLVVALAAAAPARAVVHVDSDGFHHVRERRYRQGRTGPHAARGYYDDAYDLDAVAQRVLRPLGPGGSRRYATRVHDLVTDTVVDDEWATAEPDAVVVLDATFVQRGALRDLWDAVVFLDGDLETATARGVARDADALGGTAAARAAYDERYLAACQIYLAEEDPRGRATYVVEHTDPHAPTLVCA